MPPGITLESQLPGVQNNVDYGVITEKDVFIDGDLTVTGNITPAGYTFDDTTLTGDTEIGEGGTDTLTIEADTSITGELDLATVTDLVIAATGDSVTADPTTDAPAGWLKVDVGGGARYIPFYTLTGS